MAGIRFANILRVSGRRNPISDLLEQNPGVGSAGKTILIVDDESAILEVFEFILSDAGFKVISALNGQEALATLQRLCEGYDTFLRKPFKTERLIEEISRLIDRSEKS